MPNTLRHSHRRLVERGRTWLRRQGCAIVLTELHVPTATGELPDVLGWRSSVSILIEAKVSRADFLADRRKRFREEGGMGDWRFYLTPPGIVQPAELPRGWGLLWAHPRTIRPVHGIPTGNCLWRSNRPFTANTDNERAFLVSALRRLQTHHGVPALDALIHDTGQARPTANTDPAPSRPSKEPES